VALNVAPGMRVIAHSSISGDLERRATTGIEQGEDFPVVWVCTEEAWVELKASGMQPNSIPWPADDVTPAQDV
jgi:hypothetical protein